MHVKVSCAAAQEDHAMVAPLAQVAPQAQTGQAVKVPTVAVHVGGLNPLDAPMMSAVIVTAWQGHGVSRAPPACALLSTSFTPYHLAYQYPLSSGRIAVPALHWFMAKNILEWTS